MRLEQLEESKFDLWDEACLKSDDAWLYHTTNIIRYQMGYRPELKSENMSFFIYDLNGEIVALCPLILETHKYNGLEVREFSFGGGPLPYLAFLNHVTVKQREDISKLVQERIDLLAKERKVSRYSVRLNLFSKNTHFNSLVKLGYLDVSLISQVVDCSVGPEELLKNMRKGHVADIKKATSNLEVLVFDKENVTPEIFSAYQELHLKAAGRLTRPQETFDLMYSMIKANQSILVAALKNTKFIGFALIEIYKKQACYSSAANDSEFKDLPISHGIQWATMGWLHRHGFNEYELGLQTFSPQTHDIGSIKEKNISLFKRGFGGSAKPTYIGEKYYDVSFCENILEERAKQYSNALKEQSWIY